jgi:hypothetical protein
MAASRLLAISALTVDGLLRMRVEAACRLDGVQLDDGVLWAVATDEAVLAAADVDPARGVADTTGVTDEAIIAAVRAHKAANPATAEPREDDAA